VNRSSAHPSYREDAAVGRKGVHRRWLESPSRVHFTTSSLAPNSENLRATKLDFKGNPLAHAPLAGALRGRAELGCGSGLQPGRISPSLAAAADDRTSPRHRGRRPSRTVTSAFGSIPAQAAFGVLFGELATHAWDLAAGTNPGTSPPDRGTVAATAPVNARAAAGLLPITASGFLRGTR
jgi:hypothetical protein